VDRLFGALLRGPGRISEQDGVWEQRLRGVTPGTADEWR